MLICEYLNEFGINSGTESSECKGFGGEDIEEVERKPGEDEDEDDAAKDEDGAASAPGDSSLSKLLDF